MFSAARIQALRKSKGYSQELLAEQSGVSLRTIQRVEQGETVPRGHTVQALATALDVPLEALLLMPEPVAPVAAAPALTPDSPAPSAAPSLRSDPQVLELLNLSALSLLVFPFLNLLLPYLLWRKHRHRTAHAAEVGRRVLGFQVLWQVASFFSYLMVLLLQAALFFYFGVHLKGVFLGVFVLSYLLNVVTVGYYQLLLRRGQLDIYPVRL